MKDMDLFTDSELSKKINFKEFLNSNHRALSLQRSGNVLEYFLRYGNGYKSILNNILEYDRLDCYGNEFRNTKEIWEDFMGNKIFSDDNFHVFIYKCFKLYLKSNRDKRFGDDYGHYLSLCESRQNLEEFIEFYPSFTNISKLRTELNLDKFDLYGEEVSVSDSSNYIITILDEKELYNLSPRLMLEYMNVINQNSFIRAVSFCVDYFYRNRYNVKDFNESKVRLLDYCKNELFSNKELNKKLIIFFESIKDKFEFVNLTTGVICFSFKGIYNGVNHQIRKSNMSRLSNCCINIRSFLETNKLV